MALYAQDPDIQARLPFTLDTNSKPTLARSTTIQENANRFIISYLGGEPSDINGGLRWLETEITVANIMAIHDPTNYHPFKLSIEHTKIFQNFISPGSGGVQTGNLNFDRTVI